MVEIAHNSDEMATGVTPQVVLHSPGLPTSPTAPQGGVPGTDIWTRVEGAQKTLSEYLCIVLARKWLGFGIFIAIFSVVAAYTFLVKPAYYSVAVLQLQEIENPAVERKTNINSEALFDRYVDTELGTLRSNALALKLIHSMNLTEYFHTENFLTKVGQWLATQRSKLFWDTKPRDEKFELLKKENKAVQKLERAIAVRRLGKSRLLELGMVSDDPQVAQLMLKNYIDLYLDTKLTAQRDENLEKLEWLKNELKKVQLDLLESESELVKFVADNNIFVSDDGGMTEVSDMIKKKKESLAKAQELEAKLQGLMAGDNTLRFNIRTDLVDDEMLRRLKENLAKMETDYNRMMAAYSREAPRATMLKRRIEALRDQIAKIQKDTVSSALKTARKEGEVLKASIAKAKAEALRVGGLGAKYAILKKEVDTNKELHRLLLREYKENLVKSRTATSPVVVVDPPTLPLESFWPRKSLFLGIGGILGLFGGLLGIFVSYFRQESRWTTGTVERDFNMPKLGTVPDVARLRKFHLVDDARYEFLPYRMPSSPLSDSIRNIHASILFMSLGNKNIRSVSVSSGTAGEGKTFIAVSLATALTCNNSTMTSFSRKRILVIDCDLRRPSIQNVFGGPDDTGGLTGLLTSSYRSTENVIRNHDIPGLSYITAGPQVADPAALLMSERFREVVLELNAKFDFIIFDSPPILGFPDIRILCPHSDGVLLVVEEGRLNQSELRSAAAAIASARGGRLLGLVLNKARPDKTQFTYGGYYYYDNRRSGNGSR